MKTRTKRFPNSRSRVRMKEKKEWKGERKKGKEKVLNQTERGWKMNRNDQEHWSERFSRQKEKKSRLEEKVKEKEKKSEKYEKKRVEKQNEETERFS